MADYNLTEKIAPYLDRHLVFVLQKFLLERQPNARDEILKDMLVLLSETNMVDKAMDIHKSLYRTEDVPPEMIDRLVDVVKRLNLLEKSAAPLISFLRNLGLIQELRSDKQYNLQMLKDRYQIEDLYQYAEFQFECGNYSGAADLLYHYQRLCTNSDRGVSALLKKLAAEILMQNWEIALEELNRLKKIIDSNNFVSPDQLQDRKLLMHWSLFIFFNHENGRNDIIDLFLEDWYLDAIQKNGQHLLRYVAIAVIVNKRRRLKKLIEVIQQEQCTYKDPITEFLVFVYINYDFEGAQQKLRECEDVILNDPFLGKQVQEAIPLRDEFLENARLFIFETYCRIHQFIDIGKLGSESLGEKLKMSDDELGRCLKHVRKLDPKIDSKFRFFFKTPDYSGLYEQISMLAKNMMESARAAQPTR